MARQTVVCQFLPRSVDALDLGLAAEDTLGSDLAGDTGHFAGEDLELVHHGVDGALEGGDFGVHLDRVHADLLGEVATGDGCDDLADLAEGLLEGLVCLLVLPQLALEGGDTLLLDDSKGLLLELLLLHELGVDAGQLLGLAVEELGLVVDMLLEPLEGLVDEAIAGYGVLWLGGPRGAGRAPGIAKQRVRGLVRGVGETSGRGAGAALEVVHAEHQGGQLALEVGLFGRIRAWQADLVGCADAAARDGRGCRIRGQALDQRGDHGHLADILFAHGDGRAGCRRSCGRDGGSGYERDGQRGVLSGRGGRRTAGCLLFRRRLTIGESQGKRKGNEADGQSSVSRRLALMDSRMEKRPQVWRPGRQNRCFVGESVGGRPAAGGGCRFVEPSRVSRVEFAEDLLC